MSNVDAASEFFAYGRKQTGWLGSRDPVLGKFIEKTGEIKRRIYPDAFTGLARAIIGQQISSGAQAAIWARFTEKFNPSECAMLACAEPAAIRGCGISMRKAKFITNLAQEFASGALSHAGLAELDDRALEDRLTALPGVGKWTAEMLLIFTFQRQNILSYGDLAIRRGICRLYGYEKLTRKQFDAHFAIYSPWATVASFYIWEAAAGRIAPEK